MNFCKKYFLVTFVTIILLSDAVKVNMQGSVSLGQDVMESLSFYLKRNYMSGRRTMSFTKESHDVLYTIIKSAYLCRDLRFCEKKIDKFINEYITVLTKLIQGIFEGIMNFDSKSVDDEDNQPKPIIFEEELRASLNIIKKLLRDINYKITDDNEVYLLTGINKKISALFQATAINFVTEKLEGKPADVVVAKKKLTQKIVVATTIVEQKYELKMCAEHNICSKSLECTKSFNTLLQSFKDMDEQKVKAFIRYVYSALPETFFFSILSEMTINEFQVILNDMAYSDNVPTKVVMLSLQKTVEDRINTITTKKHVINGRDVELVHVILSDMDYFYNKSKVNGFHNFLSQYFEWTRTGGKLGLHIRHLMKEINDRLMEAPPELLKKLTNEVRVFLEITVDPEIQPSM